MTGVAFFFVGAVLFVTAMQMFGKAAAKGVAVLHAILGVLLSVIVGIILFKAQATADYFSAFLLLLFVFTYLPVAATFWYGLEAKFLGWYCLVVAITMIPVAFQIWQETRGSVLTCLFSAPCGFASFCLWHWRNQLASSSPSLLCLSHYWL